MKALYTDTRHMTDAERKHWLQKYCGKRSVRFWGTESSVTPVLIPTIFGDGKKPMWLEPAATRPDYYIIAGDSAWGTNNGHENAFSDHLEEVYQAIEEFHGNSDDEREPGERLKAYERRTSWPALNTSCGMMWGGLKP